MIVSLPHVTMGIPYCFIQTSLRPAQRQNKVHDDAIHTIPLTNHPHQQFNTAFPLLQTRLKVN